MTLGQISLAIPILLTRKKSNAGALPLALFLLACGALAINSEVQQFLPDWYRLYTVLAFPALFIVCPALYIYVTKVTAKTVVPIDKQSLKLFWLIVPATMLSVLIATLPSSTHEAIFITDQAVTGTLAIATSIGMLVMMLAWLVQCVYTAVRITISLREYRTLLKNELSNCDNKTLYWVNWLMFAGIISWLLTLLTAFASSLFDHALFKVEVAAFISLILVWSVAFFGIKQESAFANDKKFSATPSNDNQDKKYQRSALTEQDIQRISEKVNQAMQEQKLFLDPELSLQKLSSHTSISPNYVSQALNQGLKMNFFDFVNHWRITQAKQQIVEGDDTVLNIAYATGFNARSSFYKAFKKELGMTPSEFRKQYKPR